MQKSTKLLKQNLKRLKVLPIAAMFLLPMSSFAQKSAEADDSRVELTYKQRHSKIVQNNNLYADGIKIKRDLSILKEVQEERVLAADEIPAEELYGGVWNNRYVNAYRAIDNVPDTFKVDLSNFTMPTMGHTTSNFGPRRRRMHYGIDLKVQVGDTIYAAFDGKVRLKQYERRGYGYYIALRHSNGLETVYGHLSKFLVEEDDVVKSGDPIALGGNTGRSTGSHLHFEFRFLGKPINPIEIVDFDNKVCHRDTYMITSNSFDYPTRASKRGAATLAAGTTRSKKTTTNKYASGSVGYHRITKGDTLGAIARKHGTSVSKICALNSITTKTVLRPGKSLRVS
ncbi:MULTISPECIES: peptidoglycan DD-metalloendopeptidase family protein [unclassified Dysgonomonas]|uniref:peptidoglycan DD-metalloendopeptidase family protein n=1 Tax=unclassified Dysgonomonas TaxID=2630389 RepID=UPI001626A824|nr:MULTISPECIES: peptidoglycan DD-metalloendopeptidase family protein [unclassified Dysgonomonas]